MNIQKINSVSLNTPKTPSFKSTIPVYHWVRETGDRFELIANLEVTQKLHEKLIGYFNHPNNQKHSIPAKKAINYLKEKDIYYSLRLKYNDRTGKKNKLTRSYYNPKGGWNYNLTKFKPISYLITGVDVDYFNDNYAKPIGRAKAEHKELKDEAASAELKMAWHNYYVNGLEFVNDKKHQIRDLYDIPYGIHTKFEVKRNTKGEIEDYNFIDLKLLPEEGQENPLVKLAMRKK